MAFTEIDEKVLVRAYQAGDERAFDTIVRTQYNALYAHALRRLSQHEAAEDAVQDTLLRAYRALPNLDGDLALRAWLHRILTNVCYDEGNRRRRQQGLVDKVSALPEETAADPVDDTVLHETVRIMSEALKDLPESYREALVLRYVDGLSFREVAEATGVSEENARARVHRGRVALHKVLSRLAVMAAFIIPGLRRAQQATETTTTAATTAAPGADSVNLATQLTSHVVQAAPTVSRLADVASTFGPAKTALTAAAVTAVAAVSVPVAVHTVQDVTDSGSRPPAATAAPAPEHKDLTSTTTTVLPAAATPSASSTTTSVPDSLAHPFAPFGESRSSTSTTVVVSTTTSTTAPPTSSSPSATPVTGEVKGTAVQATGAAPQFDVSGDVTVESPSGQHTGTLSGRLYFYDDGTAESDDLSLVVDGVTYTLRYRGRVTSSTDDSWHVDGVYRFSNATKLGFDDQGAVTVVFTDGDTSSISLTLHGKGGS